LARFEGVQTQVLGLSVDSTDCLRAWAESLGGITYPLLSDFYPHGQVAERYGVLRSVGSSERAIFVIDKSGVVRYVDVHDVGKQPDNEVLFSVLAEIEPELTAAYQAAEAKKSAAAQPVADVPQGNLIMYCTPWCSTCRQARAYLAQNGIAYTEVDISKDRAAAAKVRGWANGNETTPTFDIQGTIIVDFDQARLRAALGM
jgi:glutaredoxin